MDFENRLDTRHVRFTSDFLTSGIRKVFFCEGYPIHVIRMFNAQDIGFFVDFDWAKSSFRHKAQSELQ